LKNFSDYEMERIARSAFENLISKKNVSVIEDMECERYKIDGEKACLFVVGTGPQHFT
jgi:hypothetical protein